MTSSFTALSINYLDSYTRRGKRRAAARLHQRADQHYPIKRRTLLTCHTYTYGGCVCSECGTLHWPRHDERTRRRKRPLISIACRSSSFVYRHPFRREKRSHTIFSTIFSLVSAVCTIFGFPERVMRELSLEIKFIVSLIASLNLHLPWNV